VPRTAEEARALWGAFGVEADSLSPAVLVLGLRPQGVDVLASSLRAMAEESEPASITLSQLRRWPVSAALGSEAFVFENPSILAEAAWRGWRGPPLVCTSGWPNVAVLTMLRQLAASGCRLHLHADWDPAGCEIVRLLVARVGGDPWEMPPPLGSACGAGGGPGSRPLYEEDMRADLLRKIMESPGAGP